MSTRECNIIVTGVGGQGNVLASQIIATAAVGSGCQVAVGETYGASQRGGSVMSHIRVSSDTNKGPLIPKGQADVVLSFEPVEALRVLQTYGQDSTTVITNLRPNYPLSVLVEEQVYPEVEDVLTAIDSMSSQLVTVEATQLALDAGSAVAANMVMTGAFAGCGILDIPESTYLEVIRGLFSGEALVLNERAFTLGIGVAAVNSK
ncbi:indolepyruvate oxidoreductase subunit beta [Metallumcola ferriviriculae]|uniref:Indolepyruvate oxidoreductase subunit beta n=1 Tax=Metallumcola ferriviriculae TaxID=3039180 RepID=A0AAU0UNK4_9FIRM|nr:indolepyruvate oxidoreductase subunit beta [Desulfitibacteraceae bacterium MK1]